MRFQKLANGYGAPVGSDWYVVTAGADGRWTARCPGRPLIVADHLADVRGTLEALDAAHRAGRTAPAPAPADPFDGLN